MGVNTKVLVHISNNVNYAKWNCVVNKTLIKIGSF